MKHTIKSIFCSSLLLLGILPTTMAQTTTKIVTVDPSNINSIPHVTSAGNYYGPGKQLKEADLKSKEISKEVDAPQNGEIFLENASRNIQIKTWDQQKVKVTATIFYEEDAKLSDDALFENASLSLKAIGSSVKIKSGTMGYGNYSYGLSSTSGFSSFQQGQSVMIATAPGVYINTKNSSKMLVTITIPAGYKLDIESKYADITLPARLGDLSVVIANGSMEGENLGKLKLRSKYANIHVGNIASADIELTNGRFSAKNINDLELDSKYSSTELATVKKLVLKSINDEVEVEEAGDVRGRKNYGNLRITHLTGSLDLEGSNADIRIRNLEASVKQVKINDRYADIRIPLNAIKDFAISFEGSYSSVYGNFDKKAVAEVADDKKSEKVSVSATTIQVEGREMPPSGTKVVKGTIIGGTIPLGSTYINTSGNDNPSKFTASAGDGKGLKIDIKCQNCTVDFK